MIRQSIRLSRRDFAEISWGERKPLLRREKFTSYFQPICKDLQAQAASTFAKIKPKHTDIMTTLNDESATTILVSCKQTRFDIKNPVYSEVSDYMLENASPLRRRTVLLTSCQLDIEGLSVTVAASNAKGVKAKSKARAEGNELITSADLKLKSGVCYALIGRNGTGKSSMLVRTIDR